MQNMKTHFFSIQSSVFVAAGLILSGVHANVFLMGVAFLFAFIYLILSIISLETDA